MVICALNPPLPTEKRPLLFYSNQLRDDLKRIVLTSIAKAKQSLSIQIYGLTDSDVITALKKAKGRGVEITLFFDPKGSKALPFGQPAKGSGLMHRKILVVDKAFTLLGSANFTTPSLKMHDNLIAGFFGEETARHFSETIRDNATFSIGENRLTSFFLPDVEGKTLNALCKRIKGAQSTIELAMFTLTHKKIVAELANAAKRGIQVKVAIDSYTMRGSSRSSIETLEKAGALIYSHRGKQLLHHKWALIDGEIFVMGSANWTRAAFEKNRDCLLIFDHICPSQQKKLSKLWQTIATASKKR